MISMDAKHMLDNIATASQSVEVRDNNVVRRAILAGCRQFIELNWAHTSQELIDKLKAAENSE